MAILTSCSLSGYSKYSPEASRIRLQEFVKSAIGNPSKKRLFDFVKVFYEIYFESKKIRSIDMHGTKFAERLDLNLPHDLGEQFDAIINLGTAEHIFNVYQVFKSMHDWLKVGGRMYHNLPMYGEIDHGFYNFHPTLFWDLAFANQYKIIAIAKASAKSLTFAQSRVSLSKDISMQDKSKTYGLFVTLEKSIDKPLRFLSKVDTMTLSQIRRKLRQSGRGRERFRMNLDCHIFLR